MTHKSLTKYRLFYILLILPILAIGQELPTAVFPSITEVDNFLNAAQEEVGFPGMSVAIVKDGKLIHRKHYGYANLEHEVPVTDVSLFALYSLTKPVISVGVFSLIEQGEFSADTRIKDVLDELPKAWGKIRIKHLLSHSSGLPDMVGNNPYELQDYTEEEARTRIFDMPIRFDAGTKYEYCQTNFWLLKLIIEKVSGMALADFIKNNQFADAPQGTMLFSNDARDIIKHRVTPYFPWVKGHLAIDLWYVNGEYFQACNGLHLTLDQFLVWDQKLHQNQLISAETKAAMWEAFSYTDDEENFGYGWGIKDVAGLRGYGFSGSMSTVYRVIPQENLSIIFLSNGFSQFYSQDALMQELIMIVMQ